MQHSLSPITADSEPVMGEFSHVRFPTYWSILLTSEKFKRRRMGRRWCVSQDTSTAPTASVSPTPGPFHIAMLRTTFFK
jgi:hypothetical protein